MSIGFTVFFEDPFWVGLLTITEDDTARYCRVVFGKEPSDVELYEYLHKNFRALKFTKSQPISIGKPIISNPKRQQGMVSKELHNRIGAKKSYEALKVAEQHDKKKERREDIKIKEKARDNYIFSIKKNKAKEKHRGH